MRKLFLLPLIAAVACSNQTSAPPVAAQSKSDTSAIDLQMASPDQTVKTWWKIRDVADQDTQKQCEIGAAHYKNSDEYKFTNLIVTGPASVSTQPSDGHCVLKTYKREILEVKVESDTRAVVLARIKASTAIPQGAQLSEIELKWREEGLGYKYVLEKIGKDWKISQLYTLESGLKEEWKPYFEETVVFPTHTLVWGQQ